jgi:hypothetical protein
MWITWCKYREVGADMGEVEWERARLFPVSGIGGADEQERRASSALLAVVQSVREFGRAITTPMGAPAGRLTAYIEVPFNDGDKSCGLMACFRWFPGSGAGRRW